MCALYILRSLVNNTYYIGSTNNLIRREKEHFEGKSVYTRHLRPLELVYEQEYKTLKEARKVEKWLKKLKSRKIIEQIIRDRKITSAGVVQR